MTAAGSKDPASIGRAGRLRGDNGQRNGDVRVVNPLVG